MGWRLGHAVREGKRQVIGKSGPPRRDTAKHDQGSVFGEPRARPQRSSHRFGSYGSPDCLCPEPGPLGFLSPAVSESLSSVSLKPGKFGTRQESGKGCSVFSQSPVTVSAVAQHTQGVSQKDSPGRSQLCGSLVGN